MALRQNSKHCTMLQNSTPIYFSDLKIIILPQVEIPFTEIRFKLLILKLKINITQLLLNAIMLF